jgi:hypothetical protein
MVTKGMGEIATLTIYGHHRRIGYGYMKGEKKEVMGRQAYPEFRMITSCAILRIRY